MTDISSIFFSSTVEMGGSQIIHPDNNSANIDEGLQATVKDPLWFLARQWQTGEFEAESGGSPAQMHVEWCSTTPDQLMWEGGQKRFSAAKPLETIIEEERHSSAGLSALWNTERLEYTFSVKNKDVQLQCEEHHARRFDWFSFDITKQKRWERQVSSKSTASFTPNTLSFKGMPHARW